MENVREEDEEEEEALSEPGLAGVGGLGWNLASTLIASINSELALAAFMIL